MAEKKGLSHTAYGGIKGEDYIPYVSTSQALPELTAVSIIIGCLFAIVFGAANTYLGLKVGMTVAAGIPAAILATAVFKNAAGSKILEANMIQSMAAMGESLAGGLIFTIPAIIIFKQELTLFTIVVTALLGGLLGILFVVPLRKYLIVEEHGKLVYPEAMAASEVLVTGTAGGTGLKTMMAGLLAGGLYKILSGGFKLWNEDPSWKINATSYKSNLGLSAYASLMGVGYIVGIEIASYMLAGALVSWFALVPLIAFIAPEFKMAVSPVKYIGAGAVAAGGLISIIKAMPTIVKSFKSAMSGISGKAGQKRTDMDVPMVWVVGGAILVFLLSWVMPNLKGKNIVASLLIVICAFFFSVVSARLVGLIGTSNNPISGMTIASLLVITAALKATNNIGDSGMFIAIIAGTCVCVAAAIAGGAAQSLKTTYIMGGTPKKLEIGMYAAVVASAAAVGGVILMLHKAYGIGSETISAPQANMMSMIVKGIMDAQLPWIFVIVGVMFAVMCELMKIPVLPFALGLYLPMGLSTGVFVGGVLRVLVDKKYKKDEAVQKEKVETGTLLASGLIAGEAIIGILIAVFAVFNFEIGFGANIAKSITGSPWTAAVMFFLLCAWFYNMVAKSKVTVAVNKKPNMKA
ncbi:oligopeptide transporter, OPT family [Clostridium swellfunianum]|uniref:OPT family oligopeptide transporter n=1 Tax=Clostridium swellfunianum TaxID=1367462 RepID=UPI00202FCB5B|nr:oligopeptide transporter, OPT family [Clostridium swellfunianum]MCM0650287.1 oligopeptide transporter, OPT family [Clostridium swellfunianum]